MGRLLAQLALQRDVICSFLREKTRVGRVCDGNTKRYVIYILHEYCFARTSTQWGRSAAVAGYVCCLSFQREEYEFQMGG
jgi:hypothetical protein